MFDPKPEKIVTMIEGLCKRHQGEMLSLTLDWEILTLDNPRYGKVQQPVPLLAIDFK